MLYRVAVVTGYEGEPEGLAQALRAEGVSPAFATELTAEDGAAPVDAVLIHVASLTDERVQGVVEQAQALHVPSIALVAEEHLGEYDPPPGLDDLVVYPLRPGELALRLRHAAAHQRGPQGRGAIRAGELVIDPERYEVTLAGRRILLTYKEYQLLVLLASNPGRVYSREALLSRIWGYDYFGGTRTVDVHIRRLRSKLEDADHTYIETVWNVGYRFRLLEPSA